MILLSIFLLLPTAIFACQWPTSDVLFILDSTINVQPYDFQKELQFVEKMINHMRIDAEHTRVALATFTPKQQFSILLEENQDMRSLVTRLQSTTYAPCDTTQSNIACLPHASVNSIAKYALNQGNRKWVADVIVVISSSKYRIPELLPKEVLLSPMSPIHAFYILVGGPDISNERFEATATTLKLSAADFNALGKLEAPLCQSVDSFINRNASRPSAFGSICWIIILLLCILFFLVLCCTLYAIYVYREENRRLKYEISESERTMRKQNEYFTARIHKQMEDQMKITEKHQDELKKQQEKMHVLQEREKAASHQSSTHSQQPQQQPQPIIIYGQPMMGKGESRDGRGNRLTTGSTVTSEKGKGRGKRAQTSREGGERAESKRGERPRGYPYTHRDRYRDHPYWDPRAPMFGRSPFDDYPYWRRQALDEISEGNESREDTPQWYYKHGGSKGRHHRHNKDKDDKNGNSDGSNEGKGKDGNKHRKDSDAGSVDGHGKGKKDNHKNDGANGNGNHNGKHNDKDGSGKNHGKGDKDKDALNQSTISWKDRFLSRAGDFTPLHSAGNSSEGTEGDGSVESDLSIPIGHLSREHPSRALPPVDLVFLLDTSSSIGISNYENIKRSLCLILEDVDIAPGRSRVALIQFAAEPAVVFGFDKYFTASSVQKAIHRVTYTGGPTHLSKALNFVAGVLWREQNMADGKHRKHKLAPTPRHDRLQVLCVVSDGSSEDNITKSTTMIHEKLQIRVCALVTRSFHREKLTEITRFEGSVFVIDQKEAINIWLWRQQRVWADNYLRYLEREKSMPLDSKRSPKKTPRPIEEEK